MKKTAFILILLAGLIVPLACTNSTPTGPLATYNITATFTNTPTPTNTFTPTPTNWAGYTSTPTPGLGTNTATPSFTGTPKNTSTNTFTPTFTFTITPTASSPTPGNGSAWNTNAPPNGLAYDGAATIYVAEGVEGQMGGLIQMFNTSGVTISAPITTYDGTHTFGQPDGVAYYGGNIYVVDQVNNSVYEINPSPVSLVGSPLTTWNSTGGSAPSSFSGPEGIAVDTNGNVYIADTGNDYVEVFNSSLSTTPVTEFGGSGSFNNPSAVAVDGSGNIYVADASNPQTSNNQRVQIFTSSYVLSRQFSIGANSDIYGITLNGGNIYLADSGTGQVEEYSPSGVFLTSGLGISPANSPSPDGLAFMGSNLLVADYSNDQLYLVTP